jgi:hypothetical protein
LHHWPLAQVLDRISALTYGRFTLLATSPEAPAAGARQAHAITRCVDDLVVVPRPHGDRFVHFLSRIGVVVTDRRWRPPTIPFVWASGSCRAQTLETRPRRLLSSQVGRMITCRLPGLVRCPARNHKCPDRQNHDRSKPALLPAGDGVVIFPELTSGPVYSA